MLEILALYHFGKKIGEAAEEKGYGGILFILLFVGCWFVGEFVGCFLGLALYNNSMGMAYFLGIVSAIVGGILAFMVVAVLPNTTEDRFDSQGRHVVPKKRRKRRPRPVEDDSYREKFQPKPQKLDELEIIDDYEVEIVEEDEEVKKPAPRKAPPRPPVRKPAADTDPSRIKKPEQKAPPRPPLRKPNPNRDGLCPPER